MKARILVSLSAIALAAGFTNAAPAFAEVGVNVNVGIPVAVAPQPVYIEEPPDMVVIPRSSVYFAPGVSVDLFFYDNYWWHHRGDRWYRAGAYNGPWTTVRPRYVPAPVYRVPANYRTVYVHEERIPYGQWKKSHGEHRGKYKGNKHEGNRHEGNGHEGNRHGNGRGHHGD